MPKTMTIKNATSIFSIKKATINGKDKEFNDKILNNDIGKEYIIIIGAQMYKSDSSIVKIIRNLIVNDAGANSKFMFVHQALRRVKLNEEFCFNWTILLYKKGYSTNQINKAKEAFQKFAHYCNFIEINNYQQAINYINTKDINKKNDSEKLREKTPIERLFFYCHGFVGVLSMGLSNRSSKDENLDWDEKVVDELNSKSFSPTAKIYSFACRTGLGNPKIDKSIYEKVLVGNNFKGPGIFPQYEPVYVEKPMHLMSAKSLAQKIANKTSAIVYAYLCRSDYADTLNTTDELDFMDYFEAGERNEKPTRKNKNYDYLLNKENRKVEDVERHKKLVEIKDSRINIDGGVFDPEGARYPVKGGQTPIGTPKDMKTYKK